MGSYTRPPERPARFGDSPFLIFKNQLSGRGAGFPYGPTATCCSFEPNEVVLAS